MVIRYHSLPARMIEIISHTANIKAMPKPITPMSGYPFHRGPTLDERINAEAMIVAEDIRANESRLADLSISLMGLSKPSCLKAILKLPSAMRSSTSDALCGSSRNSSFHESSVWYNCALSKRVKTVLLLI
jgi:hypothetical protein